MADQVFYSCLCGLLAVSIGIFHQFYTTQPKPYVDEVFHIPQAQKYCEHKFYEWNPKITTLPGLYLLSLALAHVVALVSKSTVSLACSVWLLRFTNVLFMAANGWIIHRLLKQLHYPTRHTQTSSSKSKENEQENKTNITLATLSLSIFPVLYFFTFLYYTDAGSTFFVLLMYYLSLKNQHFPASLAGVVAIIFRQTNVVWVVFVAGATAVRNLESFTAKNSNNAKIAEYVEAFFGNFFQMLRDLFLYGLVVLCFLVFVFLNGGIVVGDKASHVACFNFPQIFYFIAFSAVFSLPLIIDMIQKCLNFLKSFRAQCVFIAALLLSLLAVHKFTYAHKYLLADNRHYPFYVWRKVYRRHWSVKYALVPGYLLAGWLLGNKLAVTQSLMWQLVYWACVSVVLIPQKLLEFRYFIVPYLLYRLHVPVGNRVGLVLELLLYAVVNAVTMYLFLKKPFVWDHQPDQLQRFMW